MDDYIVQHQNLQPEPYLTMVNRMYMGMGFGTLSEPTAGNTAGAVTLRLSLKCVLRSAAKTT